MATTRITWVDSITTGVTNHKVYRDDILLTTLGMAVQTYDDTTAVAGSTYKYEVQAVSPDGESIIETLGVNIQNITMAAASVNAPTSLAVGTPTTNIIPLTWVKSTSGVMTEYRVYDDDVLLQTFAGDVAAGTLTGLSASTTYTNLSVRAYNGTVESGNSNLVNGTTAAAGGLWDAAAYAIGLRQIVSTYSGPLIRMSSSKSGDPDFDVGFDINGDIDISTIEANIALGYQGKAIKYYNQGSMGASGDLELIGVNAPIIFPNPGRVLYTDGYSARPAFNMVGGRNFQNTTGGVGIPALNFSNPYSIFYGGSQPAGATQYVSSVMATNNAVDRLELKLQCDPLKNAFTCRASDGVQVLGVDTTELTEAVTHHKAIYSDGTNIIPYADGVAGTGGIVPPLGYGNLTIIFGADWNFGTGFSNSIHYLIVMPSDLEASRATFEAELNAYYTP